MRKRWQQQAAASRLAKSPRPDKKGSASADSAEAGANKASLVDKVLEGSRGKGDVADVGANKAPLGVRARDTVSEPEGSRGKDDIADVGANKTPLGVRARDAVSEPSLEIGNPSSAARVLEASCASGVFGVSSSLTPVSTTDHALGSPMTDLPVDTLADADNHKFPEASLRECSALAVSEAEHRDSPPEGFSSGGLRIGAKVKHAFEASSSKSSNFGDPASSAVMSKAGQVVKPPGVTSTSAPHVVLTEAPFKGQGPSVSHSEGVNSDVLPSGRPAPPKPPPARRTRRSCDRESSSSGVPEEDAQALLDMLYDREECPMGHPLVRFGTDQPGWSCSGCKVSFSQKKLMWGCRTCDFDLCSECLLKSKHDPVAHGSKREPWPIHDFKVVHATAANEEGRLIPRSFKARLLWNGCSRFVRFECPSDSFVGGWRTVFLLHPDGFDLPAEALCLVAKVAKSREDQLQEETCAARCPSVFCEVFAATPFNLLLAPDSKCDLHMLLSERLLPLDSLLKLGKLPEGALQELAIAALSKCCQAIDGGIRCRDLGRRNWGLALGVFEAEAGLRRVCSLWKDGATLPLKVLDGNCCTVARGPVTFPTGSRMSTFWTLMRDLLDDGKVQTLRECVKAWPLSRIVSELAPGGSVRKAVQGYA